MDEFLAMEIAYKNGLKAGKVLTVKRIFLELETLVEDWKHNRIQSIQFIDEVTKLKNKYESEIADGT